MSERKKLWAMLNRVNALCDRNTSAICQRINTRTDLRRLDELFTLGERAHVLFRRIYARYEAVTGGTHE